MLLDNSYKYRYTGIKLIIAFLLYYKKLSNKFVIDLQMSYKCNIQSILLKTEALIIVIVDVIKACFVILY